MIIVSIVVNTFSLLLVSLIFYLGPNILRPKKIKKRKKKTDKHAKGKKRKSDESEEDERKKSPKKRQGHQIEWFVAMCVCVR